MDPVNASDFSDIVTIADIDIAPDGETIAYVRKQPADATDYATSIWQVDKHGERSQQLTVTDGSDSQPRFDPAGERLAFVSDRLSEDGRAQLWILPLEGGEARQLTTVPGGVSDIEWSPDGSCIVFSQRVSTEERNAGDDCEIDEDYDREPSDPRVIDRTIFRANEQYFDRHREAVYLLEVESGTVEPISPWDESDYRQPTWGDADTIYCLSKRGDDPDDSLEHEIVAIDRSTGEVTVDTVLTGSVAGLTGSGNGQVAYTYAAGSQPTLAQANLIVRTIETGEEIVITEDLDRTVHPTIAFDPSGDGVYFITPDTGGVVIRHSPFQPQTDNVLTDPQGAVSAVAVGGETMAFTMSEWDHPGALFASSLAGENVTRLTTANEAYLENRAIGEPEPVWFTSAEGIEVQGWLLMPPEEGPTSAPHPLIVEIHGGPHGMWTASGSMWHEFQALAGAGYAVFWSNPRGSVGYGESFAAAIANDWGDVTHSDIMAGVDAVTDRDAIDETQLFLTGGSFGGYQTAWTIGRSDRFTAAVAQRGVYHIPTFFGTSDAYRLIESEFDATPYEDQLDLYDQSPLSLVNDVSTPTLIIHSDDDYRTPIATAEMYFRALRKRQVPTRLVTYPREGHELSRSGEPAHRIDRIERIQRWFDGYATHCEDKPALERSPHDGLSIGEDQSD